MNFKKHFILMTFLLSAACLSGYAQTTINLTLFSSDFTNPLVIAHCGDDRLFIVEQRGRIYICDMAGNRNTTPFLDISDRVSQTGNERGLLGLAFDPDYATNGYFYVNYTASAYNHRSHIARFLRDSNNPNVALPNSELLLLNIPQPSAIHNGGTLAFGPDGYLYIGMGDGGTGSDGNGQDMTTHLGKMLRIDVGGLSLPYGIPPDNPYVGMSNVLPEIWASGLRNPWKFAFDPLYGDLWIADVGQNEREEIDMQTSGSSGGQNYGWRCYEGTLPYNTAACNANTTAYAFPIYEYSHDIGCSITGGNVYRGAQFHAFYGKYIYADFCTGQMGLLSPGSNGGYTNEWVTLSAYHQISALGQDKYGEFYLADYLEGVIYKISAGNCAPTAVILGPDTRNLCTADTDTLYAAAADLATNISYQWSRNGLDIVGATQPVLVVTQTGQYRLRTLKTTATGCGKVSQIVNVTNLAPTPAISSSPSACIGNGTVYSVVPTADHQYLWSISAGNGTIVAGQGTPSITVVWNGGAAGTVSLTESNP